MKTRNLCAILLLFCLCIGSLSGCAQKSEQSRSFYLMDTVITVTLYEADEEYANSVFSTCKEILNELDELWSRQKDGSDTARINESTDGAVEVDERTVSLIEKALSVTRKTNGAFDITVAPLIDLWQECGERDQLPTEEELATALAFVGSDKIGVEEAHVQKQNGSVAIDLGGIGKGAAIDALIEYLNDCDVKGGLVSFGSNVAVFGSKVDETPFRIAIKDPNNPNGVVGAVSLKDGEVLSVSGDYERYVTINEEKYHHIFSTETGYPADSGLSSVAVITSDGAVADALSTALFVMGVDAALDFYETGCFDFEAVLIKSNGEIVSTEGLSNFDLT